MVISLIQRHKNSDGIKLVVESDCGGDGSKIWVSVKIDVEKYPTISELGLEQPTICVDRGDLLNAIKIL